jgi:hypothetical protein
MREILDSLKQLITSLMPRQSLFAEVVSYEETTNTITVKPTTDSDNIEGVSLDSQGDKNKGFFAVPKVGSDVLIGFIDNEPYVKMYSEVDSVLLKGNTFGGLIKIDDLATQSDAQHTAIKASIIAALTPLDTQLIALGQAGGGVVALNTVWATVLPLNKTTLENTNVKHG